ncbi:MAG TPA: glycosyltransferase [Solirubrobacteraceae bacterium]|nr:glycosyltransferase [Solirubrobacteraceae bacterium]
MRVLQVAPFPPERDGIATYTEMLCAELRRQGHDVSVLASHRSDPPPSEVAGVLGGALASPAALAERVRGLAPDVAHLQFAVATYGPRLLFVLRLLGQLRRMGIPVVVTMHEVTRDVETLGPVGRRAYRALAARADRVIVHTEPARTAYVRHLPEGPSVEVVAHPRARLPPSPVSVEQLRRRHGLSSERIVLSFGFIHVDKGLDDLLHATARLERERALDDVRVVLAGEVRRREGVQRPFELRDRRYLRRLKAIVAQERIGHRVHFTGYVPASEVRAWFEAASLAVLPYRRIEQSGAGSLASGAGTPLLTTTVGELAQMSTLQPVPPEDPDALADGLRRALADGNGDAARSARGATRTARGAARGAPRPAPATELPEVVRRTTRVYERVLEERAA